MQYHYLAREYRRVKQAVKDAMYRAAEPLRTLSLMLRFVIETIVFIGAAALLMVATVAVALVSLHNHAVYYHRVRKLHGLMVKLGAKVNNLLKLS